MARFNEITARIIAAADNPLEAAKRHCEVSGRKAVGCFKGYVPEEIVHALGMLPVGLWGAPVEISEANRFYPAFYCSPVRQLLELGIRGGLDFLSGVIIPAHCDTLKTAGQNWKVAVPHIPFLPIVYPHNRNQEFGVRYLTSELRDLRAGLEQIVGSALSNEKLWESIRVYNRYRRALREFLACAAGYPATVTARLRHQVCAAGLVLDKAEYAPLLEELTALLRSLPAETAGTRIVLTGMALEHPEILAMLGQNGLAVAADDLLQESRQVRTDTPDQGGDPIVALARRWSAMESCALLYDPHKPRGDNLVTLVRETGAAGVLFCMTTFCDPEDYDFAVLHAQLRAAGIPYSRIELGGDDAVEQARTRIQGFGEILGGR